MRKGLFSGYIERRVEIGIRLQLPKPNEVFKGICQFIDYLRTICNEDFSEGNNVAKVV